MMARQFRHVSRHATRMVLYETFVGRVIQRLVNGINGRPPHCTAEYWDGELTGRLASYLGGTLSIDVRNAVTLSLINHLAASAESVLDVGCAGGSLAETLTRS